MSNLEKASRLLQDFVFENGADVDMYYAAKDLLVADLLMPDVQVIRTVEELEALDPDTVFMNTWGDLFDVNNVHAGINTDDFPYYFPCSVVASGGQVRAAREAMEQDNGF